MTRSLLRVACLSVAMTTTLALGVHPTAEAQAQTANPCAPKAANPCAPKAANPCAPKAANPCAPKAANPCAAAAAPDVDKALFLRPKGTQPFKGDRAALIKEGKALYANEKLGTSGMSCNSCHEKNENLSASFAKAYPHPVAMVTERAGVAAPIQLDEMVQFCMVVPMAAKPLPWNSRQLAALTAYFGELQKEVRARPAGSSPKAANPCAPKAANPCAPKAANPCAAK